MNLKPLLIAGPTASGKSHIAIIACERFDGEIINADSMQIYQYLPILTDQPSQQTQSKFPHHLYGTQKIRGSASEWAKQANTKISEIQSRKKRPIVVGGTGLYFKTLQKGIVPIPNIPKETREKVRIIQNEATKENFYNYVIAQDPLIGKHLHTNDGQRIARALEVFITTGQSIFTLQNTDHSNSFEYDYTLLLPERDLVYQRIEKRVYEMFERDVIKEVEDLNKLNLPTDHPVEKAIGVPQIRKYLNGEFTIEQTIQTMVQKSRNYAKRQYTWFNNQETPKSIFTCEEDFVLYY